MGGVVLDAGQGREGRGGGYGGWAVGSGQWAGKWTVGNRTMQKFLGGLSHTSNYASSLQTAIGLARKCPDAGDMNEAKQIEMDRRAREGRRALGSRVSAGGQSLVKTGSCDGWDGTQAHGGVVQCRWGVHRLQVLGATRYVPCPGGTWVPRLCSQYPCLAPSGFFGWEWAEGGPWDAR